MNKVVLIGNLTRDPEMNGSVCKMSLATNEYSKDKEKVVEYHRITAFGKTAELCQQYLSKGSKVAFEGRLKTNKWEDKEGVKRATTEVIVGNVEFVSTKAENKAAAPAEDNSSQPADDGVPF